jgi:release factor glutamine methyltransferase
MIHHAAKVAFMLLCCMMTVKDVFDDYKRTLHNLYEASELETITLIAAGEVSGFSNAKIKAFPELEVPQQQTKKLKDMLARLKTGEPIQYILGKTEFYGLPFNVNPSVLIPRPETEELVEWALSSAGSGQWAAGSGQCAVCSVLDIGTGSGCIAISLKKHLPGAKVSAIDISAEALATAKENAKLNDVDIDFIEGDILIESSLSQISNLKSQISIIISNPPYVTLHDKTKMHTNVTDCEPHTALFVPEDDPLIFYKAIADFATKNLVSNGLLFFEINESYGEEVVELLSGKGFKDIELRKDMSGRDRMVKGCLNHDL